MNFRKTYMCVYLCRSTLRSHSSSALFRVDCLGLKGLRRGKKGGISMKKKKTVLMFFQSEWNSKVSDFSQTTFFSKVHWLSFDTPRG